MLPFAFSFILFYLYTDFLPVCSFTDFSLPFIFSSFINIFLFCSTNWKLNPNVTLHSTAVWIKAVLKHGSYQFRSSWLNYGGKSDSWGGHRRKTEGTRALWRPTSDFIGKELCRIPEVWVYEFLVTTAWICPAIAQRWLKDPSFKKKRVRTPAGSSRHIIRSST